MTSDPTVPSFWLVLVAMAIGIAIAMCYFVLPSKRAPAEIGLTPIYEERCTGRVYWGLGFFGGFQTMRVSFYDSFFVLSSIFRRVIAYGDVGLVEYKPLAMHMGIVIHMRNRDGQFALFARNPKKVADVFESKSVAVTRES